MNAAIRWMTYAPRELPAVADGLTLWWCGLEAPADAARDLAAALSPAEAMRHRWIVGRVALRTVLGGVLGIEPAAVPIVRGVRGRPELQGGGTGLDFNVSHTDGFALIGVLQTPGRSQRLGVDVERRDRQVGVDRLSRRVLAPEEQHALADLPPDERRQRFLRYWTCKEAMSKATGDGLIAPFREIHVEPGALPRVVAGPRAYAPAAWSLHAAPVPSDHFATVALWNRSAETGEHRP
jgi:4'-phosphopantetheinyl transferase